MCVCVCVCVESGGAGGGGGGRATDDAINTSATPIGLVRDVIDTKYQHSWTHFR